jgi:glutaminyl-peptide cyclotransferase
MYRLIWSFLWLSCAVAYRALNADRIRTLVADYPPSQFLTIDDRDGFLEPILKVRIPGSQGSEEVRQHFTSFFESLDSDWTVEFDQFYADTPTQSQVNFTNVIATRDPPGSDPSTIRRLTLAAHYDSKIEPEGFIGAIDSAVPCALIMHAVNSIDGRLTDKWTQPRTRKPGAGTVGSKQKRSPDFDSDRSIGLQIIFFDGEEAFRTWTDSDSIYGARHLADKMARTPRKPGQSKESQLASIETLVLLDLIGAEGTMINSFFANTHWMFKKLKDIESRLKQTGASNLDYTIFQEREAFTLGGSYGDDHLPFLYAGVPVLHLIPVQFPATWHRITDDAAHLDQNSIDNWGMLMSVFLAEYFEVFSSIPATKSEL